MASSRSRLVDRALPWFRKGSWTLVDQALYAGTNFVLNFALAVWLPKAEYGAFAIAFTVFLYFGAVHTGLITEPMLVFGPGRYGTQGGSYLRRLIRGHAGFAVVSAVVLLAAGIAVWQLGSRPLATALLAVALAQAFILLLWLMRRACYVRVRPQISAIGGVIYSITSILGGYAFYKAGVLSVANILLLMSAGSVLACITIWILLRPGADDMGDPLPRGEILAAHKSYGSWAVATGLLGLLPSTVGYLVVPIVLGLEGAAALKAVFNFIMPAAHAYAALSLLLVPIFVRAVQKNQLDKYVSVTLALLLVGNGTYWLGIGIFSDTLVNLVYSQYNAYAGLLWYAGAYPFVSGLAVVVRTALRAREQPNLVFWASLASSASALTLGIYLILSFGLKGAVIGTVINIAVELVIMTHLYRTRRRSVSIVPPGIEVTERLIT